jgi:hypothetical protein
MLAHPREVSIVGAAGAADTRALLDACATGYRPHQIMVYGIDVDLLMKDLNGTVVMF